MARLVGAGLLGVTLCGCSRPENAQNELVTPGTVRRAPEQWTEPPRKPVPEAPSAEFARALWDGLSDQSAWKWRTSREGSVCLIWRRDTSGGRIELVAATGESRVTWAKEAPAGMNVRAGISPDLQYVYVEAGPAPEDRFQFFRLALGEEPELRLVGSSRGPAGSATSWLPAYLGGDGTAVYYTSRQPGRIWSVAVPTCEWELMHTQGHGMHEGRPWEASELMSSDYQGGPTGLLTSPSGRLLLYSAYPPDDFRCLSVWVLDRETLQARHVTWETSGLYYHWPVCWGETDSDLDFVCDSGTYCVTLPEDLWAEEP